MGSVGKSVTSIFYLEGHMHSNSGTFNWFGFPVLAALGGLPFVGSCHSDAPGIREQVEAYGTVTLPLEATAPSGAIYRLVGEFTITGATTLSLSTVNHTGSSISQQLGVGQYGIALNSGWTLQRNESGTFVPTSNAQLIGPSTQTFDITRDAVTRVTFSFEVDGQVVFAEGELQVDFSVQERPPGVGGSGGSGGAGGASGSNTGGSTGTARLHNEVFWAFPSNTTPNVKYVETLMPLRNEPTTLLAASQVEGSDCGTGPGAAIWRMTLEPTTRVPSSVSFIQQLSGTQSVRGAMIESGTDGTLLTGGGWCGATPPYYSTDHGQTWSVAVSGGSYPSNSVFGYVEFNGAIYAGTGYRPNPGEVYRWMGNATWQRVYSLGAARNIVQALATFGGQLFVGGTLYESCGVCEGTTAVAVSTDGQTFAPTVGIPACHQAFKLFDVQGGLYALTAPCGSEERFIYSWDPVTATWSVLRSIGDLRVDSIRLAVSRGAMYAKSSDLRSVMVSRDIGRTWEALPDLGANLSGEIMAIVNVNDTIYWTALKGSDGQARVFRVAE